jgi:helicase
MTSRGLQTRAGLIRFPAYIPVTTFGNKYPLDKLIQPYLPRLADAVMVSYHYARQMEKRLPLPMMVDSGGFASLFKNARVKRVRGLGVIEIERDGDVERITPQQVLAVQEAVADVAFTLDFPIPPGTGKREATKRLDLTVRNAHWALENRRRRDLPMYACVQAWDVESARDCARSFSNCDFDGLAIGGLVPRARDTELVTSVVRAVRDVADGKPLHVFGIGSPELVTELFRLGVDSVDSSAYVKLAADGRRWGKDAEATPMERMHLALCNLATVRAHSLPLSAHRIVFTTEPVRRRSSELTVS